MIEFEINSEKNSKIDLLSLYAICGEDEDRKTRLLVIGYLDYSSKVPVTDLTSPLHSCRFSMIEEIALRKFVRILELIHKPHVVLMITILLPLYFGQTKRKIEKSSFSTNLDYLSLTFLPKSIDKLKFICYT